MIHLYERRLSLLVVYERNETEGGPSTNLCGLKLESIHFPDIYQRAVVNHEINAPINFRPPMHIVQDRGPACRGWLHGYGAVRVIWKEDGAQKTSRCLVKVSIYLSELHEYSDAHTGRIHNHSVTEVKRKIL